MILDNKRHLCLFAAAFIWGIILFYRPAVIWIPLLLLLGALILLVLKTCEVKKETAVCGCLTAALILFAFFLCYNQNHKYQSILNASETVTETELTGVVIRKEKKSSNYLFYLNHTTYLKENKKAEGGNVLVYFDEDSIPIGSVVKVRGTMDQFPHATNEGEFDLADYYQSRNISFRVFADSVMVSRFPKRLFREKLYKIQKSISAVFESELNSRDAGILSTLVLGNKGLLDSEIKQLYQDAGISHILAISGLHISILGIGVYRFLRSCRCSYWISAGIGSGLVFSFTVMSGMGVSAKRALIMYLLVMGAEVLGRTYDGSNALALASLILLIGNPMSLFQSGFLFSFTAMIALIVFIPKIQSEDDEPVIKGNHIRGNLCETCIKFFKKINRQILSGFVLQLFLLPLTAWFYYEVPVYALFLNLLIIPLCGWLLGCGLLGGIVGLIFPEPSKWILVVCHVILSVYEKAIGITEVLPFHQVITGQPPAWLMLIYYAVLCFTIILWKQRDYLFSVSYGRICCLFLSAVLLCAILFFPKKNHFYVSFLDVGQGDGICISDGAGKYIMIDGGSTSGSEVGKYIIGPFLKYRGIKKIDAWIVTHGDEDHCSGVLELLHDGYEVDYLLLAEAMAQDASWYQLVDAAMENGTEVIYVSSGDALQLQNCEMECLYPSKDDSGDANALSQVWSLKKGDMSVLFTGDIGEEQEEMLLKRNQMEEYVILKTAHHGSKYSSCDAFLQKVSPDYAIISCGENNRYGHPHAETLDRLEKAGSHILQTQYEGQITLFEDREVWHIKSFLLSFAD